MIKFLHILLRSKSYLNGTNSVYVDELFHSWKANPANVNKSWNDLFSILDQEIPSEIANIPSISTNILPPHQTTHEIVQTSNDIDLNRKIYHIIQNYKSFGHTVAKLDPLEMNDIIISTKSPLSESFWNLSQKDMDQYVNQPSNLLPSLNDDHVTVKGIISHLKSTFCGSIGAEFMHIEDQEIVLWIGAKLTELQQFPFSEPETRIIALKRLCQAHGIEEILGRKFPSEKRFGLEGCEALIPCLGHIIDFSSIKGAREFVIGMPHRGRLNVLANICQVPPSSLFYLFNANITNMFNNGAGDVKYHLGTHRTVLCDKVKEEISLTLLCNPSHLEAVTPMVLGTVKAEQYYSDRTANRKIVPVILHGDAAFSGQGVVYESFQLSNLEGYNVNGTIHVVTNNQIGFTTDPKDFKSSRYCTDIAKIVQAPIFHVNANDIDAVLRVTQLAVEYYTKYNRDVVIDLIGYRRNGHNEGDNPSFTQPVMYQKISDLVPVVDLYSKKLIECTVIDENIGNDFLRESKDFLESEFSKSRKMDHFPASDFQDIKPREIKSYQSQEFIFEHGIETGYDVTMLKEFNEKCCKVPEDLSISPVLSRTLKNRMLMLNEGFIDWSMGEISAFSSLLADGFHIRFSGQDVQRGTFSHRHHVFHDVSGKKKYIPLNHISKEQSEYVIHNSHLSEYGVLGFELGYSYANPNSLVLWEAQFGDFSNNAQCIFDQFLSSSEEKWNKKSGIVVLLPHGYDGMGPEHSSARIERFLSFSKDDPDVFPNFEGQDFEVSQLRSNNIIVVNCTTPANIFHALRRQIKAPFRKPLIVISPKNLLRLEAARSHISELTIGTRFKRVIDDFTIVDSNGVEKVIFCSGKIYYELFDERKLKSLDNKVAIVRLEQLAPFPFDLIQLITKKYPKAIHLWVQEEPKNQGPWNYVASRFATSSGKVIRFVGRESSAATATGLKKMHLIQQTKLIQEAFT